MSPRIQVGWIAFVACLTLAAPPAHAAKVAKVNGYLEYRKKDALVVDGQRVLTTPKTQFKGSGKAKSIATIPKHLSASPMAMSIRRNTTRSWK